MPRRLSFLGDTVKASRSFTADGLDYRRNPGHVTILTGFDSRDGVGVSEAAKGARTIRVA
jgi:hypothetical protein